MFIAPQNTEIWVISWKDYKEIGVISWKNHTKIGRISSNDDTVISMKGMEIFSNPLRVQYSLSLHFHLQFASVHDLPTSLSRRSR